MKQRIPKAIYSKEFREAAVRQVTEEGLGLKEAARRLSLPHSTLSGWVKAARMGTLGSVRHEQSPMVPHGQTQTCPKSIV
jgi:transposase